jgi:hypothetical protein
MLPNFKQAFAPKNEVHPVRHGRGLRRESDENATYLNVTADRSDGTTVYGLTVTDVPVYTFWTISVYDVDGYFQPNPHKAQSLDNLTAKKDADGGIAVQFGDCDGKDLN